MIEEKKTGGKLLVKKTIDLQLPVKTAEDEIKSIELRRVKVGDILASQVGSDAANEVALVARLSGINPEDLNEVDFADWSRVQEALSYFLGKAGS